MRRCRPRKSASVWAWITEVDYSEKAIDHLESFDPPIAERIMDKVDEAAKWPDHRLDPLSGLEYHKLRIGEYRAIVTWDRGNEAIVVEAVGHRRKVYDRHLPP